MLKSFTASSSTLKRST